MSDYVARTLSYIDEKGSSREVEEHEIINFPEPLIILAEPGLGKTVLLESIRRETGWKLRSAASFVGHPHPESIVPDGERILIDGLDELSAAKESDPVYRVLHQLIRAGCPPFILSCRAAEWRGAIARRDISDEYGVAPRELTLNPFSRDGALEYLSSTLGLDRAEKVIAYLDEMAIADLYGNPLTLKLFGEVAKDSADLPRTRAELMQRASEILWRETSDSHDKSDLAHMDRETALNAAGAVSAALVLTGHEAITLNPSSAGTPGTLQAADLRSLPGGADARVMIGSRLFKRVERVVDQYKPIHRSVAEFLGGRWIAKWTTTPLARARVLQMLHIDGGVPSSLRGIHAWLAQDRNYASAVIRTDPYGVLRYGDADSLSIDQGKELLHALKVLEQESPYFRAEDWTRHSAKGLTHIDLLSDIQQILATPTTSYHLGHFS